MHDMGVLSGKIICQRLEENRNLEARLVVSPLLEPEEQLREDQASIDVRLGFQFAFVAPSAYGAINEFDSELKDTEEVPLSNLYKKHYVPFGSEIIIHPHQFILAETLEYIRLPSDMMAYVVGRSTWGRLGLIVATAIGIHPGFAGVLTLELRNLGETPLALHPGQQIAQLFFHLVDSGDTNTDVFGQYSGSVDILPRKMSSQKTRKKISKLRNNKKIS